jgi:uncharacterized protein YneR
MDWSWLGGVVFNLAAALFIKRTANQEIQRGVEAEFRKEYPKFAAVRSWVDPVCFYVFCVSAATWCLVGLMRLNP